jgi:hypothetical protein
MSGIPEAKSMKPLRGGRTVAFPQLRCELRGAESTQPAVQQILADPAAISGPRTIVRLAAESTCAITMVHLGNTIISSRWKHGEKSYGTGVQP